jgi:1,4-alpha-glucan branching enzyme
MTGHFVLMLHAHLPFVRHPEHAFFLEEDWLFEAVADCYLPLLDLLDGHARDGVRAPFSMSVSPTLATMLTDDLLRQRTARYLGLRRQLAELDASRRTPGDPFRQASDFYVERTRRQARQYEDLGRDPCAALRRHAQEGRLELCTCAATHGLFPWLGDEGAIRAQLWHAVRNHARVFGREPLGVWMPECGVVPGAAKLLGEQDLRFTFVETHAALLADPPPAAGCYEPFYGDRGVAFFARDPACARQVWSADQGYPGDPSYREFYRDLGWDLPLDVVKPFIQATGARKNTGLKLHRVTGKVDLGQKQPYDPQVAASRAREHARHFVEGRVETARAVAEVVGAPPVVVAPFDAELFGHWWFEGPLFLDHALRLLASTDGAPRPTTPPLYLRAHPTHPVAVPASSTWGDGGYLRVWCQEGVEWIPRAAREALCHFRQAVDPDAARMDGWRGRVARQAARELLLAQSSDWPFLVKGGDGYARARPTTHLSRFWRLMRMWERPVAVLDPEEERDLSLVEARDNVFPEADRGVFD